MATPFSTHGGDLAAARTQYPDAPEPWLDLSTGVNPVPYPLPTLDTAAFARLPAPAEIARLEAAAMRRYGACDASWAVAAPGTQAIIQALPLLLPARRVAILGPTYSEHERAWAAAGAEIVHGRRLEDLRDGDIAVVVNPNNPDGRLVPRDALQELAQTLAARGATLIVDEAFADMLESAASLVPVLPDHGAIVLRSFGKAYGLAGLRLGFAITGPKHAATLRRAFGPWAVSGPAAAIGQTALEDGLWIEAAKRRLARDGNAFERLMRDLGFSIIGGTPLFRLVARDDAEAAFVALAGAGILVRPFAEDLTRLRLAIPHRDADRDRLRAALATVEPRRRALMRQP